MERFVVDTTIALFERDGLPAAPVEPAGVAAGLRAERDDLLTRRADLVADYAARLIDRTAYRSAMDAISQRLAAIEAELAPGTGHRTRWRRWSRRTRPGRAVRGAMDIAAQRAVMWTLWRLTPVPMPKSKKASQGARA